MATPTPGSRDAAEATLGPAGHPHPRAPASSLVAWLVASYLSFSRGISDANDRVPEVVHAQLAAAGRDAHVDPHDDPRARHRRRQRERPGEPPLRLDHARCAPTRESTGLAYLSIPRDLRVEIPGYGTAKINAAFQVGGPTLTLQTVKALTGIDVNHVAFVDFDRFQELIDAVGGIEVTVPRPILSNRFDCPYATSKRCRRMGRLALRARPAAHGRSARPGLLADPREPARPVRDRPRPRPPPAAGDPGDGGQAHERWAPPLKLPFIGCDIVKPLATDLSAGQVLQLGWAYFRADPQKALHCRLGGEPGDADGQSVIFGSEDNVATVAMFLGRSAPLPPPKGLPYAPGCVVGDREL